MNSQRGESLFTYGSIRLLIFPSRILGHLVSGLSLSETKRSIGTSLLFDKEYSISDLVSSLQKNAYAVIENAVPENICSEILAVTALPVVSVNSNNLTSVIQGKTQFFTNIIAHSKLVHDIITSPLVLYLCAATLGDGFHLINNRIQTTRASIAMPWHTDNNLLSDGKLVGRHPMPGLQFVLYLTNVAAAPFQLIKDSHEWSLNYKNQYITDEELGRSSYDIVNLTPSPGSLLILNTHLFHRAAPIRDSNYMRSILLFQADKIFPEYPDHGEKLLINPAFLDELSAEVVSFLGFGRNRSYPPFPESSLSTIDLEQAYPLLIKILKSLPRLTLITLLKRTLSADVLAKIKNNSVFANSNVLANTKGPY